MASTLNFVIEQVEREKGISREVIVDAVETAVLTAVKRKMGQEVELEAQFNPETGEIEVFQFRTVVEEVEDPEREISLEVSEAALDVLGEAGFDPVYGARPLKRFLQRQLETKVARVLIAGEIADGSQVVVDVSAGELVVKIQLQQ